MNRDGIYEWMNSLQPVHKHFLTGDLEVSSRALSYRERRSVQPLQPTEYPIEIWKAELPLPPEDDRAFLRSGLKGLAVGCMETCCGFHLTPRLGLGHPWAGIWIQEREVARAWVPLLSAVFVGLWVEWPERPRGSWLCTVQIYRAKTIAAGPCISDKISVSLVICYQT